MAVALRPGLSFCTAGDQVVFLDLCEDRYFQVHGELTAEVRRFLCSRNPRTEDFPRLLKAGILRRGERSLAAAEMQLTVARRRPRSLSQGRGDAIEIAFALISEVRVRRALRSGGLHKMVEELIDRRQRIGSPVSPDDPGPSRVIRSFEAAKLFRSPANLCLSRSIAMVQRLASFGCRAQLVMGVRVSPFAAHSWAQFDDLVLNDTPEEVARFEPILVV